jgi:heterodisulfide reductase subunit A
MYALKEAILIKEQDPNIDVTIFYMDMRAFGKGYYRYHLKAKELGVNFLRCRVSRIRESPKTENLLLLARSEDGKSISREFDLVVLSVGQCPSPRTAELSKVLGVDINQWGFIKTQDLWLVRTSKEGIFSAGAEAPVDISETVTRASAAACEASLLLSPARKMQAGKKVKSKKLPSGDEDVRVAIIICRCGQEIASVLDMKDLASFAASLPGVVHVEEVDYLCLPETMEKVKQAITKSRANRVIFAACTPYHYQRLFDGVLQEVGIDSSLWQLLNFREQLAWVHKDTRPMAIEKAHSLLAMAIERLKVQQTLSVSSTSVNHRGLVIGGGISGIIASMCLAEQGFEVHLVEKGSKLKGHITDMYYDLENKDLQAFSNSICQRIETNNRIHVHLKSEVVELTGQVGDFKTKIKTGNEVTTIQNGVVIIATGAKDYQPTEYKYGSDKRIITQKELQKRLVNGIPDKLSRVVMIQCVGSRDDKQPWCSRACCSEAIANALKIKEQNPDVNVFILNRDIMTYGLKEEEYIRARESGILFLRYEPDKKPEINIKDRTIVIQIDDPALPGRLQIEADLLVLSTGIIPGENKELAKILSLELNEDGFFKEIDTKFRPVDTIIDGIFICGLANAPRCLGEEIIQAEAAAQRAANVLAKERLESGRFISEVNARKCSGCGLCVTVCPYKARWIDEEKKVAVVREAICQGCGACVAVCPSGAAKLRGLKDNQVFAMIEAAL